MFHSLNTYYDLNFDMFMQYLLFPEREESKEGSKTGEKKLLFSDS